MVGANSQASFMLRSNKVKDYDCANMSSKVSESANELCR